MRNIWCREYGACLDRAAQKNEQGFSCSDCPMVEDDGGRPYHPSDIHMDAFCCARLVAVMFGSKKAVNTLEPPWGPTALSPMWSDK